ncbi:MAG: glutaminyl-peptide cyclotransferase [Deltaproteobacteria bacterium]|nr:glutaminyl-peptide cyclotransferase [Deltaproteobacteria bacterium]
MIIRIIAQRLTAVFLVFIFTSSFACAASEIVKNENRLVIDVYPHDKNSQTEGLIYLKGYIYEGTGPCKDGPSSLRKLDLKTGKILQYLALPSPVFGEGITVDGDRIIQLTYRTKTGYVYGLENFNLLKKFSYDTEGWGLTSDGTSLIMSDGTSTLHFLDPDTFKELKTIKVHDKNGEIRAVNELEYIKGYLYANIFLTDNIIKICPDTGMVLKTFRLNEILKGYFRSSFDKPANGIAYDPENDHLFITGKYWPYLFRIKLPH